MSPMKYDPAEDNEFQQNREPKRGVSFGTVFMLALTAVTLFFAGFVLIRLSSGRPADLSGLTEQVFSYAQEDRDETEPIDVSVTAQTTAKPAAAVPAEESRAAGAARLRSPSGVPPRWRRISGRADIFRTPKNTIILIS